MAINQDSEHKLDRYGYVREIYKKLNNGYSSGSVDTVKALKKIYPGISCPLRTLNELKNFLEKITFEDKDKLSKKNKKQPAPRKSKLDKTEIKNLRESGLTLSQIANKAGVTKQQISSILKKMV
jgi:predicted transcriptional regulator